MLTEALTAKPPTAIAGRRILRMAVGTALGIWISQAMSWPMAFVAPLLAFVFLSLPLPRPSLKMTFSFILVLALSSYAGVVLLPFLQYARWVGVGLFVLALFHTFHFTAKGGSAALGTFMTVGLTLVAAVGSVSSVVMVEIAKWMTISAVWAMVFVWLAHALIPDPPPSSDLAAKKPSPAPRPDPETARLRAMRSMLIVLPVALILFFSSASTSYVVVMIKVATMGQQANIDSSRSAGRSMLLSTVIGGFGAIIAWQILSIWPSLFVYTLVVLLLALLVGPKIFQGPGLHPKGARWSYAYLTMIVVLAPAVTDGFGSNGATSAFYTRLFLFIVIAVYGSIAVAVFDAFWPKVMGGDSSLRGSPAPA
jgi:uncharacterized membrane protein YgaE (UPF0421/DUF939 family)